MRAYTTAVVASALSVERRWLDAVIAQDEIEGVLREKQGVSRAIAPSAVVVIALALTLIETLQLPVRRALGIARSLIVERGTHSPAPGLTIRFDIASLERQIAERLAEAVAAHPPARRGRPPRSS